MPRFFVSRDAVCGEDITLVGENAHHIARSLRMAVGESITVCDTDGNEYFCSISGFEDDRAVTAHIISSARSETEPPCRVRLFQALSKGDKLDTVIQKAVECGAYEIIPFESERCVVRVKADAEERKTERRRRIAEEAAKQCGRGMLPSVGSTVGFDEALRIASQSGVKIFCYEGEGTEPLGVLLERELVPDENGRLPDVSVMIGSEGGFSPEEAETARRAGMRPVGLGKRILRTETAPIFVLSCIVCRSELS